ncbi:MAG: 5-formyltetrahydrofolate cyclo-ligase [Gracilimonas sp.]
MNSIKDEKQKFRKEVLSKRGQLSEKEWIEKSNQIIQNLISTDFFKKADTIHSYISMNSRREVCTDDIFSVIFKNDKKAVVPITNFSDNTLSHTEITSESELESNKWGVREPKSTKAVDITTLNLIIIPMVAADRNGNRLGYGKGFYDRFLKKTNGKKAGLVFDEFLYDKIPVEEFDIKLDVLITEKGVIYP